MQKQLEQGLSHFTALKISKAAQIKVKGGSSADFIIIEDNIDN